MRNAILLNYWFVVSSKKFPGLEFGFLLLYRKFLVLKFQITYCVWEKVPYVVIPKFCVADEVSVIQYRFLKLMIGFRVLIAQIVVFAIKICYNFTLRQILIQKISGNTTKWYFNTKIIANTRVWNFDSRNVIANRMNWNFHRKKPPTPTRECEISRNSIH